MIVHASISQTLVPPLLSFLSCLAAEKKNQKSHGNELERNGAVGPGAVHAVPTVLLLDLLRCNIPARDRMIVRVRSQTRSLD